MPTQVGEKQRLAGKAIGFTTLLEPYAGAGRRSPGESMYIRKQLKNDYPNFHRWLYQDFSKVQKNSKTWKAFLDWSGLGSAASIYIGSGCIPEIRTEPLINAQAMYRKKDGDVIIIDSFLLSCVESNLPTRPKAFGLLAESTILHEMCHWAKSLGTVPKYKDDYGAGNIERGKHFERAAYGGDVRLVVSGQGASVQIKSFSKNPVKL